MPILMNNLMIEEDKLDQEQEVSYGDMKKCVQSSTNESTYTKGILKEKDYLSL